jgi:hypothetical protein
MRLIGTMMLVGALIVRAGVAECAWTVGADGTCVRKWAPSDMLRGPVAIANGPFQPVRAMVGGAEYAWNKTEWRWWYTAVLGSGAIGVSGAVGAVEGIWWMLTGTADLLTGGYFEIAPERAMDRSVRPEVSTALVPTTPATQTEDRCGRPIAAAK